LEQAPGDAALWILAVGEDVETGGEDLLEQFRAPASAVEDDGDAALADERPYLSEDPGKHRDEAGVGLCGDQEQRISGRVTDPVVGGGRHGDAHASHVGLGDGVLAVVGADVTVDIQEAQGLAP
jgi:hypothetical protein